MNYVRKIAVVILSLLVIALSMFAAAEEDFQANDWVMVGAGEVVYKDSGLQKAVTKTSECKLVKLSSVSDGAAEVRSGNKTAYVALESVSHLCYGDQLVAKRETNLYEEASTESNYKTVQAGTKVNFVSISGDCVKVRYDDGEGYMYMKHLDFVNGSRRFIVAIPTSIE